MGNTCSVAIHPHVQMPLALWQPLPVALCPRPAAGTPGPHPLGAEPPAYGKEPHLAPQGASPFLSVLPPNSEGPKRPGLWAPSPPTAWSQAGADIAREGPTSGFRLCCWRPRFRHWVGLRTEIPGNELQTRDLGLTEHVTWGLAKCQGDWSFCPRALKKRLPSHQRVMCGWFLDPVSLRLFPFSP